VKGNLQGAKLYANEIVLLILQLFRENSWGLKKTAIVCLGKLCEHTAGDLSHVGEVVALVLDGVSGRPWAGKEVLFSTITTLVKHLKQQIPPASVQPLTLAILVECSKKRENDYRKPAVECLGMLCQTFAIDSFEQAKIELIDIVSIEAETDSDRSEQKSISQLQAAAYRTFGQLWLKRPTDTALRASWHQTQTANWRWLLDTLLKGLGGGLPWNVRAAILTSVLSR